MMLSPEQVHQIAGAKTHILWQPPIRKPLGCTITEGSDGTVHSSTLVKVISAN